MTELFVPTHSVTYKLIRHDHAKDILYFEGNWWMAGETHRELEAYRFNKEYDPKRNNGFIVAPRPNKETKEIELDKYLLPSL